MRWEENWGAIMPSSVVSAAEALEEEHPPTYQLGFTVVPDQLCSRISIRELRAMGWQITRSGESGPILRIPGGQHHYLRTEVGLAHSGVDIYLDFVILPPSPYRPGGAAIIDEDNAWHLGRRRYCCLLDWRARYSTMAARDCSVLDYDQPGCTTGYLTIVPAAPIAPTPTHTPERPHTSSPQQLESPTPSGRPRGVPDDRDRPRGVPDDRPWWASARQRANQGGHIGTVVREP